MEITTTTIEINVFIYECASCGISFERTNRLEVPPVRCRDCGEFNSFHEDIETRIIPVARDLHCPICNQSFKSSTFLDNEIRDENANWLANMITHYRHNHLISWDNMWGRGGYGWNKLSETEYEKQKQIVNERAKRQILRKTKEYMIKKGFTIDHLHMLSNSDEATINLYEKMLPKK